MYTKPIDAISFSEIKNFILEKNPESIILDYKHTWPKDLEKVMAAMANTQGGIIFVGVTEENKTGVPQDIVGVDLGNGEDELRQKIVSKAYKGIYPPLMPEISICRLDKYPDKAVVVIRILQSDQAPHAVDQRRRVYVRVDSQSEPHSLANLQQLEWLWEKRRKAEEGRITLVQAAQKRAEWLLHFKRPTAQAEPPLFLRLWIAPYFYSGQEAFSSNAVMDILRNKQVASSGRQFPDHSLKIRSVPLGCCAYADSERKKNVEYIELSTGGLIFNELIYDDIDGETGLKILHILKLLNQIQMVFDFAERAFDEADLWGLLQVHISLQNVQGVLLASQGVFTPYMVVDPKLFRATDETIIILNEIIAIQDFQENIANLTKQAIKTTLWAFGISWNDSQFDDWWKQFE